MRTYHIKVYAKACTKYTITKPQSLQEICSGLAWYSARTPSDMVRSAFNKTLLVNECLQARNNIPAQLRIIETHCIIQ